MTLKEKIDQLRYGDRIQVEIIENRLGLSYIGTFNRNNGKYFYMLDDDGKLITIPKEFLKDVVKMQ